MTNLQKITLRISEVRTRLNEIAGLEGKALTEKISAESETLQVEYKELETRNRAAIAAEPDPQESTTDTGDAEQREQAELRGPGPALPIFSALRPAARRSLVRRLNMRKSISARTRATYR